MERVDHSRLLETVTARMRTRPKHSNYYSSLEEFRSSWEQNTMQGWRDGEDLLLLEKEESMYSLYYLCDTWNWIDTMEEIVTDAPKVISVVQREPSVEQELRSLGVYKRYQRMRRNGDGREPAKEPEVCWCTGEECDALLQMMGETFDRFTDHIPRRAELARMIEDHSVICKRTFSPGGATGFKDLLFLRIREKPPISAWCVYQIKCAEAVSALP